LELPDAFLSLSATYEKYKKLIIKVVAFVFGMFVVANGQVHLLNAIGGKIDPNIDTILAGLVVSGGAESFNSIIKFLGYAKENKKAAAATSTNVAGTMALREMQLK
jgi:hypothetical protein